LQPALNPKQTINERFNQKFYVPSKYLNPYGSPHSTYANLVVTSRSLATDRTYVSPENSSRKVEASIEKTKGEPFAQRPKAEKTDRRNITVKRSSIGKFLDPQYMQVNKSAVFEQTLS
jgi:hypothetical protein